MNDRQLENPLLNYIKRPTPGEGVKKQKTKGDSREAKVAPVGQEQKIKPHKEPSRRSRKEPTLSVAQLSDKSIAHDQQSVISSEISLSHQ